MNGVVRDQVERVPGRRLPPRDAADRAGRRHPHLRRGDRRSRRREPPRRLPRPDARASATACASTSTPPTPGRARSRPSRTATASARTSPTSSSPRRGTSAIPARYVGGYLFQPALSQQQSQGRPATRRRRPTPRMPAMPGPRRWSPDLGWVGFDPANGISPTDAYVRVAVGLDYLGAAPVRGTRYGGARRIPLRQGDRPRCGARADDDLRALFPLPARPAWPESSCRPESGGRRQP